MTRTFLISLSFSVLILPVQTACAAPFQIGTPELTPISQQTSEQNAAGEEAEGKRTVHIQKSAKTLVEAITGNKDNSTENESNESERLDPDRPHLPEASTMVGKGRMILEGGYTFNERNASSFSAHDAPEALFRAGVFAEWIEVRVGQNFLKQQSTISGVTSRVAGIQDLYLGVKVALSRQKRYLPEIALIPQMTVPTGNHEVTGGRIWPGLNVDGTWEIIPSRYGIEFVVSNNQVSDGLHASHFEFATGVTQVFQVSRKLEAFGEWDVYKGSIDPLAGARHYAVGGLVLFATKEFALDFRAGAGLNAEANRFLVGAGFAFRH